MNEDKNNVVANIDLTIIKICKWLQKELTSSELYPIDGIKALAELISAKALLEQVCHSFSDSPRE